MKHFLRIFVEISEVSWAGAELKTQLGRIKSFEMFSHQLILVTEVDPV
jgi:hypothetical protein